MVFGFNNLCNIVNKILNWDAIPSPAQNATQTLLQHESETRLKKILLVGYIFTFFVLTLGKQQQLC